jgi:hypothetical protein
VRLWHGIFANDRWELLEEIPTPHGIGDYLNSSDLVHWRDSLAWIMPVAAADGAGSMLVLIRGPAEWSSQRVAVPSPGHVAATYSRRHGLSAAVVQAGADNVAQHNLSLYTAASKWRVVGTAATTAHGQPIHYPRFLSSDSALIWYSAPAAGSQPGLELHIMKDPLGNPGSDDIVATGITYAAPIAGTPFLATTHDPPQPVGVQIAIRQLSNGLPILQLRSTFAGEFGATSLGDGRLMLTGPALEGGILVSKFLFVDVKCSH